MLKVYSKTFNLKMMHRPLNYIFYSVPKIMAFQLIELETVLHDQNNPQQHHVQNIHCPFCHHAVIDWSEEQYVQPCAHTLFIAMDLGFEYISDEFESTMQRTVDDIHADDENSNVFDEISKSSYPEFSVYKSDLGVEGMYRYLGFAN